MVSVAPNVICSVAEKPARCKLVLIVEDELLIGISFQAAFEEEGFDAHLAASPEEAFAFLAHETPSAAIVDLNLRTPMDGIEVVHRLAAHGVKVVICSAYDRRKIDPPLDVAAYLRKPCDPGELVATVKSALSL
jgi:DNA-binding response OmpR family regulator